MLDNYKNTRIIYFSFLLNSIIPSYLNFFILKFNMLFFSLNNSNLLVVTTILKNHINFQFDRLVELVVSDNLSKGFSRFELTYVFFSTAFSSKLGLKLFNKSFSVFSISSIFKSANWLEREAWDMFGIRFLFHKELTRILSDYGFKGHPLRKDFPLYGYIDLYYSDIDTKCILSPVVLSQMFRNFTFENPWLLWKD